MKPSKVQQQKFQFYFDHTLGYGNKCGSCNKKGIIIMFIKWSVIFRCKKCKGLWAIVTKKPTDKIILETILK